MLKLEPDYIKDTMPMAFIADIYDIMLGGDELSPELLCKDMVDLIGRYLDEHKDGK